MPSNNVKIENHGPGIINIKDSRLPDTEAVGYLLLNRREF